GSLTIADALSFFRLSCGRWRSQRSVHHLLHRRAEAGGSLIVVVELDPADSRLLAIAELHGQDPAGLVGGCWVRWSASMAWDRAGEDHQGESVIGLIPTDERGREGLLLRDLGYAEKAPASSRFHMDERDGLLLSTEYETMNVWERFAFAGPDVRLRSSTVEGLSNNASFCIETRCSDSNGDGASTRPSAAAADNGATPALSPLGW
uniref:phycobiliprotein lyase n=1 Tax=Vulcanococcus sp. TaxID=2856995 RepID=UPI0037DA6EBB